jgi:hypothetical protein
VYEVLPIAFAISFAILDLETRVPIIMWHSKMAKHKKETKSESPILSNAIIASNGSS